VNEVGIILANVAYRPLFSPQPDKCKKAIVIGLQMDELIMISPSPVR
jgi:hypothetical protein